VRPRSARRSAAACPGGVLANDLQVRYRRGVHHARETLRREGYRLTPQRTLIWEVVRSHGRHMTAEEIAVEVHQKLPDVNLSTVYRTLELLVGLDLVSETRLGTSRTYFEVAPEPVHHHFVCESCGTVGHISDDLLDSLYGSLWDEQGFRATGSRTTVFGLCKGCQGKTALKEVPRGAHT
jgi:Fur family transcriptional regulator, ferric uptake regulator